MPDLDGDLDLTAARVRALCDRRAGIGADGVLRVVRSESSDETREFADQAPFFMDYRNADGSLAEMCGNGIRVFLRYLQRVGLVGQLQHLRARLCLVLRSAEDPERLFHQATSFSVKRAAFAAALKGSMPTRRRVAMKVSALPSTVARSRR